MSYDSKKGHHCTLISWSQLRTLNAQSYFFYLYSTDPVIDPHLAFKIPDPVAPFLRLQPKIIELFSHSSVLPVVAIKHNKKEKEKNHLWSGPGSVCCFLNAYENFTDLFKCKRKLWYESDFCSHDLRVFNGFFQ